jgi:hypothetical protein
MTYWEKDPVWSRPAWSGVTLLTTSARDVANRFCSPDRTPKEGMSEVCAAFKGHVQEEHPEDVDRLNLGRSSGTSK